MNVKVRTSNVDLGAFSTLAKRIQGRFRFLVDTDPVLSISGGDAQESPINLHITNEKKDALFTVDLERGITVSCYQSEGICQYANIDRETLTLICSLLGLVQWRSLNSNPLLRPEDLLVSGGGSCLFHRPEVREDYALLLDERKICAGCFEFYCCLGVEPELAALREVLTHVNEN